MFLVLMGPKRSMCNNFKAMFVSRNSLSGKSLFKLSCVCLPLEKLVNGKHFSVNRKYFPVNENTFRSTENIFRSMKNTFQSKKNLVWFLEKCFPFWLCLFFRNCLPLENLVNGKHFLVKGKFGLVFRKVFSWKIWAENTFRKLWKI